MYKLSLDSGIKESLFLPLQNIDHQSQKKAREDFSVDFLSTG